MTAVVCEYGTLITYCNVVVKKRVNGFVCQHVKGVGSGIVLCHSAQAADL